MIVLKDVIEIKASPEEVFAWLINIKTGKDYQAWHPDHVDWQWIKGEPFEKSSVVYLKEYLHGEIHKFKSICTNIVTDRLIAYKPLLPWSLFMLSSRFTIESKGRNSCIFTATVNFRSFPFIMRILKSQLEGTRLHMKEEGENLKQILEG